MSKDLIGKILKHSYSYPKSKKELGLLRRIAKGEVDEAELEYGFDLQYYSAVFNICTEFGEQALSNIPLLNKFNNRAVDMQEEYMPSYPPISPITNSYFAGWLVLDALIDDSLTVGILYSRYIAEKKTMLYSQRAMMALNDSFVSFYQVAGGDLHNAILWDMIGKKEIIARTAILDPSRVQYRPAVGEVWYARILPPLREGDYPYTVFNTIYVFRSTGRDDWEAFFDRECVLLPEGRAGLPGFLKRGKFFGYWLEFVFQAYVGYTGEAIFLEGLPDIKESRPHNHLDRGRLST